MSALTSKTPQYWALNVAIAQANDDHREAPWYGPWNLVLQQMFEGFSPTASGYYTATYPQFPLHKNVDVVDFDEESDEEMNDQVETFRRSPAPSPEVFRGNRSSLPQTPPNLPQTPSKWVFGQTRQKSQSHTTRFPDFVQLLFQIKVDNRTVNTNPLIYRAGLILLVEIKKTQPACELFHFLKVIRQTNQQARHAFNTYPNVSAFGLIIALGDCWTYREYHRSDMRSSPTLSESLDPTFMNFDVSATKSWRRYEFVERIFKAPGFARLQTKTSDEALIAVRERLAVLGKQLFT